MIVFVPYARFDLISPLGVHEAEARLATRVQPRSLFRGAFFNRLSKSNTTFEGKIENQRFNINRVLRYRNSFLPYIIGEFHDELDRTRISFRMHPHVAVILFVPIFIFVLLVSFFNVGDIFIGKEGSFPLAMPLIGFLIFFYVVIMGFFNYEVNKALRALEEIFQVGRAPF